MSVFMIFFKWFRRKARGGAKLQSALERNKEAAAALDAAVKEVLQR